MSADQHEFVGFRCVRPSSTEAEASGDQVENVAGIVLGDPQQALTAIDVGRKRFQELLELMRPERLVGTKRKRLKAVAGEMPVGVRWSAFPIQGVREESLRAR